MLPRWKIATTPGIFSAVVVSSLVTRPLAIVAPTGTAYSIPAKWKSEVYWATPVTLSGPSTRTVSRPIHEAAGDACGCVAMLISPSAGSAVRRRLQGVRQAPLRQLDLEFVFALRFGVAQRGFGSLSTVICLRRFAHKRRFRLGRAPRLRSNSA